MLIHSVSERMVTKIINHVILIMIIVNYFTPILLIIINYSIPILLIIINYSIPILMIIMNYLIGRLISD